MNAWIVEPIGGVLGARVKGIDLRLPLSDSERGELYGLLLEHLVLVFPQQSIEDSHQMGLLVPWGRPYIHPIGPPHRRRPACEVFALSGPPL